MDWIVLSYSLSSKQGSAPRVTLWRRLRRLGAISPTSGLYILPAQSECIEAFQWLAQEIQHSHGQTLLMHVEQFEGLTDQQLIDLFHEARQEDYVVIEQQADQLEQAIRGDLEAEEVENLRTSLAKLRRHYAEAAQLDYFDSPAGTRVAVRLAKLVQALAQDPASTPQIQPVAVAAYQAKQWVTRPQPHVDRLACIWLIRRLINPDAVIHYADRPEPDQVSFDLPGADFGHTGNLCTFETMLKAFHFEAPGLSILAEIVHEIDLRDGRYLHSEIAGIDAVLQGWLLLNLPDVELESRGLALFDGLLATLAARN